MLIEKGTDKAVYTLRVVIDDEPPRLLVEVVAAIEDAVAKVGDSTRVNHGLRHTVRDIDIMVRDGAHLEEVLERIGLISGVRIQAVLNHVEEMHREGKIRIEPKYKIKSISDVRKLYTPGVAYICKLIQQDESLLAKYTWVKSTVAIVTNGTAILGLGDIGVKAGLPVMEGKSLLLAELAGLNGIPILVNTKDPEELVRTVASIAHSFGAIKLEDVASPECFEVEDRLKAMLDIPVMHDDQHGTAVVVLASLLNACRYTGQQIKTAKIGIIGLGAAGIGIATLLHAYGVRSIQGVDLKEHAMQRLKDRVGGQPTTLRGLMESSDIVISTTGAPGLIKPEMVRKRQVIFALSNPNPEIKPEAALAAGALFAADGRSVNNALAFPGLFKGALSSGAKCINNRMKIAAAEAIAAEADEGDIVPSLLKEGLHARVAAKVERAAFESGANLSKDK